MTAMNLPPEGRSRSFDIKRRILRRAWRGEGDKTPAEAMAMLQRHYQRMLFVSHIPKAHQFAIAAAKDYSHLPRAVQGLNLLERYEFLQWMRKNPEKTIDDYIDEKGYPESMKFCDSGPEWADSSQTQEVADKIVKEVKAKGPDKKGGPP